MQPEVKNILTENDLCVLCTCSGDIPDASLMLYMCDERCAKLYMLTRRDTDKYRNIANNKNVSVLVDTRDAADGRAAWTRALTVHGEASIIEDSGAAGELIRRMAAKHESLSNLAADGSVCVIEVLMKRILFLENVDKAIDITLPGQ